MERINSSYSIHIASPEAASEDIMRLDKRGIWNIPQLIASLIEQHKKKAVVAKAGEGMRLKPLTSLDQLEKGMM